MSVESLKPALIFIADKEGCYVKHYSQHNCAITIDERKKRIIYPAGIRLGDDTTTNFAHPENFVVLECVDRLLQKGYRPEDLHLEKKWSLGRTQKSGKADIIVSGSKGKTLLIIECKTWGEEYEKEKRRMQSNGGQLFSYLQQEHSAEYLCLYTSTVENGEVRFENAIIHIEDDAKLLEQAEKSSDEIRLYREAQNVEDFHLAWKESYSCYFHPNGIFDDDVQPYQIKLKALTLKDLKEIKMGDSGFIHNQFAEILRHNNISDKENAFNKMISLFLCKVVDENRAENTELAFQWKEGVDTYENLQDRLLKLYHEGMKDYLNEEIVYYGNDFVETAFKHHKKAVAKDLMNIMLKELKFYTNNEFAFKEVHNKKLFEQNAKVVNEVVQLLQPYRIKYSNKQQFLGNLFELLLNDGLKQSEGQFFTPIPITRLILSSLPIRELISTRLNAGQVHRLPRVIDYACGSGHFLTEAIDEIQASIEALDISDYRENTSWARDYIFGVEKDYRLARTAKIACFLNGAGDARIIYGDGLEQHDALGAEGSFDILVANPPYSIKDFKQHLRLKRNSFELFPYLSDSASEIETLFIERIRQLLKPGGMAGIVLPSSILSNSGIYTRAREIILKYFHLRSVVELGGQTFIATNTNTVILFLQKRDNEDNLHVAYRADSIFDDGQFEDLEYQDGQLLHDYCCQIGVKYDDYVSLVGKAPSEELKKSEFLGNYRRWFDGLTEIVKRKESTSFKKKTKQEQLDELEWLFISKLLEREKEKFFFFCLAHGQQVVIVKAGDKEKEKAFLGYEWSKRRGQEGMKVVGPGKLYDEMDFSNPERVNSYIRQAFLGASTGVVHGTIADHISHAKLIDMMDFSRIEFDKQIFLTPKKTIVMESKWPTKKLSDLIEIVSGGTPNTNNPEYWNGDIPWLSVVDFNNEFRWVSQSEKRITAAGLSNSNATWLNPGDLIISARGTVGALAQVAIPMTFNQSCYGLRGLSDIDNGFLYYMLKREVAQFKLNAYGTKFDSITIRTFDDIKIPLPPLGVQQKIVEEIEVIEKQATKDADEIERLFNLIRETVSNLESVLYTQRFIGDTFNINHLSCDPRKTFGERLFTYVDIESIINGTGEISVEKKIKGKDAPSRARRCAEPGSTLLSTVRPNLKGFAFINDVPNDFVFSTGLAILKSKDERVFSTKLLYYLCMFSSALMAQMIAKMPKSGYPSININDLNTFQIPDISLSEQTRIVAELDSRELRIRDLKSEIAAAESRKSAILEGYLR